MKRKAWNLENLNEMVRQDENEEVELAKGKVLEPGNFRGIKRENVRARDSGRR